MKKRILLLLAVFLIGCQTTGSIKLSDSTEPSAAKDNPIVLGITKTYNPSASTTPIGIVTWTLTMSRALETAPSMSVEFGEDVPTDVPCSLDGANPAIVTCTYDAVDTCTRLKQYVGIVSGGGDADGNMMDAVSLSWNAADDEFDTQSIDECWDFQGAAVSTWNIENGEFQINVFDWPQDSETEQPNITKSLLILDFAVIIHIAENIQPENIPPDSFTGIGLGTTPTSFFSIGLNEGYYTIMSVFARQMNEYPAAALLTFLTKTDDADFSLYISDGSWGDPSRYTYLCETRFGNVRSTYASADGENFIHFSSANSVLFMHENPEGPTPLDYDLTGLEFFPLAAHIFTYDPALLGYAPKIDLVRFKSDGITGTANDCAAAF